MANEKVEATRDQAIAVLKKHLGLDDDDAIAIVSGIEDLVAESVIAEARRRRAS
jgi:hypothetical protein